MSRARPAAVLAMALAAGAHAQTWMSVGGVTGAESLHNGAVFTAGWTRVRIEALSPTVVRVRYSADTRFARPPSIAVLPGAFPAAPPSVKLERTDGAYLLRIGARVVRVDRRSFSISFLNEAGEVVSRDHPERPALFNGTSFKLVKSMPPKEAYYGLGDKSGALNRRNSAFTFWTTDAWLWQESTDPVYKSVPFLLAAERGRAYGYFLDNSFRGFFDLGKEYRDAYSFGAEDGPADYYFFYGPTAKDVIRDYTALVGRTPLPPLWALGYQQSRQNYNDAETFLKHAAEFRKRRIPADVLYMDGGYTLEERSFTVDTKRFPDLPGMVRSLGESGFKVVTSAYFTIAAREGDRAYDTGMAGGHFVHRPDGAVHVGKSWPGDTVYPDFARAETRRWWGGLYDEFAKAGIRGFWNDMNEPAVEDSDLPIDTVYDADGRKATHREMHNLYGMLENQATYEGLLRLKPDLRLFLLTRAGWAGTQRYAATWTGDNTSTWNHMRVSVPGLLNLGLSGWTLSGDDIGGFSGFSSGPSAELMTRWMQLGAFNPLFRNHAEEHTRPREPWTDGPEHEAVRRKFIEARYRLMPYLYTGMEEASRTGMPLMRPLFLEFPEEPGVASNADAFMFGDALLVAPKVWDIPGEYVVALPKGKWFDYWTGEPVEGGNALRVDPPLDTMPVYARAGRIVPHQPLVQHAGETPRGPLELRVYPGPDCRGDVYADDGDSFAFRRGGFLRLSFSCAQRPDGLDVTISAADGPFVPWFREIAIRAYGLGRRVRSVAFDGKPISGWTAEGGALSVRVPWSRKSASIRIALDAPAPPPSK
ncbi:MAG: glycoside hydrolase family 31 protein [Elusimicrobia bacterium]|nr:glycoside hydrolase family 31 protein [Elusimicrobiota bacterium]